MRERPIIFSSPMVRAILEGRKTQTRRILKIQPPDDGYQLLRVVDTSGPRKKINKLHWGKVSDNKLRVLHSDERHFDCPYGQPGDQLWVRETWGNVAFATDEDGFHYAWNPDRPSIKVRELPFGKGYYSGHIIYRADGEFEWSNEYGDEQSCWHPSIHMPRAASRITLEITNIRIERLNDISEEDARAEGVHRRMDYEKNCYWTESYVFSELWESINGSGSWVLNPWVWVIEFKRVES